MLGTRYAPFASLPIIVLAFHAHESFTRLASAAPTGRGKGVFAASVCVTWAAALPPLAIRAKTTAHTQLPRAHARPLTIASILTRGLSAAERSRKRGDDYRIRLGLLARSPGAGRIGSRVRSQERGLERPRVNRAQVAVRPPHSAPAACDGSHRLRRKLAEVALFSGIEHEVQISTARGERGKGAPWGTERDAIEVRIRARVLERERELLGALCGHGHAGKGIMVPERYRRPTLVRFNVIWTARTPSAVCSSVPQSRDGCPDQPPSNTHPPTGF